MTVYHLENPRRATARYPLTQMIRRAWLVLVSLFLAVACGDDIRVDPLAPGDVILAFGDSVTHGTGAGAGRDYPRQLAGKTGLEVVNAGIPGDTAAAAKRRLAAELDRHNPDLVIVELGGNDFLARRSAAQVKEDLKEMVTTIREHGSQAILVAVPEFSVLRATTGTLRDSGIYTEIGTELGVPVIDDLLADILSSESLRADPIHPNAGGYEALAEGIHRALIEHGFVAPD